MRYPTKLIIISFLIFAGPLSFFSIRAQNIPMFDAKEWSGKATMTYRVTDKQFFSEMRFEATISKGEGIATHNSRMRSQTKEITQIGSAQGSGPTSLHIGFGEDPPTYSISIPVPAAVGTKTRTVKGSGSETLTMGEDESAIMIPDQPLGNNTDILSGTFEITSTEHGATATQIFTWSFYRGPLDVDLIVRSLEYKIWLPEPGPDESVPGKKPLKIILDLIGKNNKPPRFNAKQYELELKNTSRENGIAINAPVAASSSPGPDLRFLEGKGATISNEGQTMVLKASDDGKDDVVTIGSFDGGGYATLIVDAILENGARVRGQLENPGGPTEITIPKRKSDSRIATFWLELNGNPADDSDEDKSTGNSNNGDGISAYEEYRGIISQGKYHRLDPRKKELGVRVDSLQYFSGGLDLLARISDIVVIPLKENELGADRVLNKNSSRANNNSQHAMLLVQGPLPKGVAGENQPPEQKGKTPKDSKQVIIDIKQLRDSIPVGVLKKFIDATVAHELAHGIGVDHHGPSSDEPGRMIEKTTGEATYHIYAVNGKEITSRPFEIKPKVGEIGCEASGDISCIMTYNAEYKWALRQSSQGAGIFYYYEVPALPEGSRLCTSSKGTGINANSYFGDATWGNCLSKIKVRDE